MHEYALVFNRLSLDRDSEEFECHRFSRLITSDQSHATEIASTVPPSVYSRYLRVTAHYPFFQAASKA
jgi:hypothetical protein